MVFYLVYKMTRQQPTPDMIAKTHCCMQGCNKLATYMGICKSIKNSHPYCDKHKDYQEKECKWHWKEFIKIKEEKR